MLGTPEIQGGFGLSHQSLALLLFVVPLGLSLLLEPPLLVLADRRPRKPFVVGGLGVMAVLQVVVGLSPSLPLTAVCLALIPSASGCACGVAQATIVDADPQRRERWMTRWALLGTLGDLAAPGLLAAVSLLGGGWRHGFLLGGAVTALYAAAVARRPFPAPAGGAADGPATPPVWAALAEAARSRRLLAWLTGVFLCSFFDEVLVAFGSLHLRQLGAGPFLRSVAFAVWSAGAVTGLAAAERLLARVPPRRLLAACAAGAAASYLAWLATPSVALSIPLLGLTGALAAPLYPIAKTQAFRTLPGRPATVNAVSQLFTPAEVALPLVLGLLADRWGLQATLLVLVLQPLGLLLLALLTRRGAG